MREIFDKLIRDEQLMKDVRMWLAIAFPFLIALVYWLFIDNLQLGGIDLRSFGALTVFYYLGFIVITLDTSDRTFDEVLQNSEHEKSKEWRNVEKDIKDNEPAIDDQKYGLDFIKELNVGGQESANKALTMKKVQYLHKKASKLQGKHKYEEAQRCIENAEKLGLKENWLHNKDFTPFEYTEIASVTVKGNTHKRDYMDARDIRSKPIGRELHRTWKSGLIRSVWFGGGFALGISFSESLIIVGLYIISIAFMQVTTIAGVTKSTRSYIYETHISKRNNKLKLMKKMNEFITTAKTKEEAVKLAQETQEKPQDTQTTEMVLEV